MNKHTAPTDTPDALRVALDNARDADRAKSRFLATVSHEIRTPLNGLIGMGKLLADTELTPEQHSYVDAITSSGEALLLLVNDLLEFGRLESGDTQARAESVDIRTMVAGVVELMANQAHAKGLDFGYYIAPDVPVQLTLVPGHLRQVLFNVIGNAVKFTEIGGVSITIETDGRVLTIAVSDSGPGIDEAAAEKIFQPFEQAESGLARSHEGAGLGLSIAKRLVEAGGGSLSLTSEPGVGSCFTITLPMRDAEPLVIDDVGFLEAMPVSLIMQAGPERDMIARYLRDSKADMHIADALDFAAIAPNSIIIVDKRLPDEIDALAAEIDNHHIVALIEPIQRGSTGALFKAEGHSYLTRPIRPSTAHRILAAISQGGSLPERVEPQKPKASRKRKRRALNVLMAEDNAINAILTRRLLEDAGHTVTHVEDGAAACDAARVQAFDVILMDLHMPVMDGVDAIEHIRRNEEETGGIAVPIFALTADTTDHTRQIVINAGGTDLMPKPLSTDMLATIDRSVQSL
ncbi:MAG: ATP-binding protein [Ahrensia sp.]